MTTTTPSPAAYQPYLDELTQWASSEARKPALLAAKAQYFDRTGEVYEDDKAFEMRMASFLECYLFEATSGATGKTPAQELYEEKLKQGDPRAPAFRAFSETIHGLFEVRRMAKEAVRLRELFSGKDFDVTERRQLAGLEKGDLIEARLIPFDGHLLFSAAFCYHPKAAVKLIKNEMKRRKKKEPTRSPRDLAWECSRRALKADRYRQIAVEKIYDFSNNKI